MTDQATQLRRMVERGRLADGGALGSALPASVPTGAVSYRPRPSRRRAPSGRVRPMKLARAIAVTSGKGGVGKSNIAVNLAVTLSRLKRKVCLLDADLGLANVDLLCNLTPKRTLEHVVKGQCRLTEVMLLAPGGFRLIPGASGVAGMANLSDRERAVLLGQLAVLERVADVIIIDCAAGLSANVLAFAGAAHTAVVATTTEPTAVTDAYGMVKSLLRQSPKADVRLVVNMVSEAEEAETVFWRMNRVVETFLGRSIEFGGAIPLDAQVSAAVRYRLPFALLAPEGRATRAVERLGRRLVGSEGELSGDGRRVGFFGRLTSWLGKSGAGEKAAVFP